MTKTDFVSECSPRSSREQRTVPGVCGSRASQDEGDGGCARRTKAAPRVSVGERWDMRDARARREVCRAAPQTAFRRERGVRKVSARECARPRAGAWQ